MDNLTFSHNFIWSTEIEFGALFGCIVPLVFCMLSGCFGLGIFKAETSPSVERKRFWRDVVIFTIIQLLEGGTLWAYIFVTPFFATSETQIAMFVILFGGPPLMSYLLFSNVVHVILTYRKNVLKEFGVDQVPPSWDSVCDILFPVKYILAHVAFVLSSLTIIIFGGGILLIWSIFTGLTSLITLQAILKRKVLVYEDNDPCEMLCGEIFRKSEGDVSTVDLLHCILIHLASFSIPELVMVIMNMNLPNSRESQALTIVFIVLVCLESLFGILYLEKWSKLPRNQPATMSPPANPWEVPYGSYDAEMTFRPSTSTAPIVAIPVNNVINQEVRYAVVADSTSQQPAKRLDDKEDNDNSLAEPPWINPSRYSSYQSGASSEQAAYQPHVPMPSTGTGLLARQNIDIERGSDALECPICYMTGTKKKVIVVCGHMLCEKCLEDLRERTGSNLCPFCNQEINLTTDLYF